MASTQITHDELFDIAALDSEFYCRTFFPTTFREPSPVFHRDIWSLLESRQFSHVAIEVFRGGGKTTLLRTFASKRIAYGVSRTIEYVSEAQDLSTKSLIWMKKQVEYNKFWADTFGLEKGDKWSDEWIEIKHRLLGITISVVALGITGQTRGMNIDDYRPDLIIIDDPCDEENTLSPEQRKKMADLFGGLEKSLAPVAPNPDAKMVLLQTSLHPEDLINQCHRDPEWATRKYSCFNQDGSSRWPEVFPTAGLVARKQFHLNRNELPLWLREMECTTVGGEAAYFKSDWLQYYEHLPEDTVCFIGVDPVPPPSDRAIEKGLVDNDYECLFVMGVSQGRFFVVDYELSRGHTPEWTVTKFFELVDKYRPLRIRIETIAYQRVLKWMFEQEMRKRGRYVQIDEAPKRPKSVKIKQAYSGIGSQRQLYVRRSHHQFITDFISYPYGTHDDLLDAGAMAKECAEGSGVGMLEGAGVYGLSEPKALDMSWRYDIP